MYCILRDCLRIPGLYEEYGHVLPSSGMGFRHPSDPLSCRVWRSQIWHYTYILFNGKFQHYRHSLFAYDSTPSMPPSHEYPHCITFEPVSASTQSVILSDIKLLGAGTAQPSPTQLNISMYARSVCESHHVPAITVILRVNQSFGGWCPPHVYSRCTAWAICTHT
jgi:hypothetical protein